MQTYRQTYLQRKAEREANAPINAAKRAKREQDSMHCQCCNRKILANTGMIAHHGYKRPGHGWQTSSCMGARYQPFEAGRMRLGEMITFLRERRKTMVKHLADTKAEVIPVPHEVAISHNRVTNRTSDHTFRITRANFAKAKAIIGEVELYRFSGLRPDSFDELKEKEVEYQTRRVKDITSHIKSEQARFDGWKQTHKREGDQWVSL